MRKRWTSAPAQRVSSSKSVVGFKRALRAGLVLASMLAALPLAHAGWEPRKPVEFIVPAGTGGGADQMARLIKAIVARHQLMSQPLLVVNKSGGAGAEGFLEVKGHKGDPHRIIITLSNLFTTPLSTGVPFNWRDLTPVSMMALDQFVLWVNAANPASTARDYIAAVKSAGPGKFKMGGTATRQEDQILTLEVEKATDTRFAYVPFKGGGEVAAQVAGKHIDSSVNNPVEAVAYWRAHKLRALCVFDHERMPYKNKVTEAESWNDIPTCEEAGIPAQYNMLRGIFMAPGVSAEQREFFVNLMAKVRQTQEWKDFMEKGAFNQTSASGAAFVNWLEKAEQQHKALMREAGFLSR